MVRRRMASPKPSPPVHRRASSPMSARSSPSVPMKAHQPTAPSMTPSAQFGVAPPSRGPGLMGQMAATAGGVAIGSAVGHAVGNMLTGGSSHGNQDGIIQSEKQQMEQQKEYRNPCEFEWKQFIEWLHRVTLSKEITALVMKRKVVLNVHFLLHSNFLQNTEVELPRHRTTSAYAKVLMKFSSSAVQKSMIKSDAIGQLLDCFKGCSESLIARTSLEMACLIEIMNYAKFHTTISLLSVPNAEKYGHEARMTRALHYVFKIANRKLSRDFFVDILKMKVLRHEEFEEGCKATCNGPYDGKWSKTMVGYGSEDDHFVLELTYNYPISSYKLGICIRSTDVFENCRNYQMSTIMMNGEVEVKDPDGHKFYILPSGPGSVVGDPIYKLKLNTSDLKKTVDYWSKLPNFVKVKSNGNRFVVSVNEKKIELQWNLINTKIDRRTGFGRIAFSVPTEEKQDKNFDSFSKIDTPGKTTVEVIILADPNDHEICFVGDEAFRELSRIDLDADKKLLKAINDDKSEKYKIPAW
ncbi:Glyoxalase domain-containing protein 4 [Dirofilaria immitis]|nr:Glyoxalase domain-containing protein 4 [Dirofilaria immitis]